MKRLRVLLIFSLVFCCNVSAMMDEIKMSETKKKELSFNAEMEKISSIDIIDFHYNSSESSDDVDYNYGFLSNVQEKKENILSTLSNICCKKKRWSFYGDDEEEESGIKEKKSFLRFAKPTGKRLDLFSCCRCFHRRQKHACSCLLHCLYNSFYCMVGCFGGKKGPNNPIIWSDFFGKGSDKDVLF